MDSVLAWSTLLARAREKLSIGLLIAKENGRDLDNTVMVVGNENEAIPTDPSAVAPLPLLALERLHITLEGIVLHPINRPADGDLMITGKHTQLPGGWWGEANGPWHRHTPTG